MNTKPDKHTCAELLAAYRAAGCSESNLREFLKEGLEQQERFRSREVYEQENAGKYAPCRSCGGTVYGRVGNRCFACY
jgi:hypothetical protein